jgi:hypothetical protein
LTTALMHGKINPYVLRFRPAIILQTPFFVTRSFYPGVYPVERTGSSLRKGPEHQREDPANH